MYKCSFISASSQRQAGHALTLHQPEPTATTTVHSAERQQSTLKPALESTPGKPWCCQHFADVKSIRYTYTISLRRLTLLAVFAA